MSEELAYADANARAGHDDGCRLLAPIDLPLGYAGNRIDSLAHDMVIIHPPASSSIQASIQASLHHLFSNVKLATQRCQEGLDPMIQSIKRANASEPVKPTPAIEINVTSKYAQSV